MKQPDSKITVITDIPNNGYAAMVFTDDSVRVSSHCRGSELFHGLVSLTADLLSESSDTDIMEDPSQYLDDINKGVNTFMSCLTTAIAHNLTKSLMEKAKPENYEEMLEMLRNAFKDNDD